MRWVFAIAFFLIFFFASAPASAQDGTISMKDPTLGENRLVIPFEHKQGNPSDHVHLFVDGIFKTAVVGQDVVIIRGLKPGSHVIELIEATRDHEVKTACQKMEVTMTSMKTGEWIIGPCEP